MSSLHNRGSIAILALLVSVMAVGAIPVHATAVLPCVIVFQTGTTTGIAPGTTGVTLTYSLVYPSNYPATSTSASFGLSAVSSNPAWTGVGVGPTLVGPGTSFEYYPITVTVNAPSTPGSTTTLTVTATDEQSEGRGCNLQTGLSTSGTPPSTIPEFPLGMLVLIALALPAMILLKKRFSVAIPV